MREDIMYMITYPDGTLMMNTQKYYRRDCVRYWLSGTNWTCNRCIRKAFAVKK